MNDLFPTHPEDKLEEALALLAAGIPVADILAEAGADADWLRPLLNVASEVGELKSAMPLPASDASLQRMLSYSRTLAEAAPPKNLESGSWLGAFIQLLNGGWLPRLATGAVMAMMLVFLMGGTLVVLAQRSLPGQPLYTVKRMGETLQLTLTQDTAMREQLQKNFNQRRQEEAQLLLQEGGAETVTFEGKVDALTADYLTLDGLSIQLTSQTKINGDLAVGARVNLEAMTQPPDALIALTLTVIEPAPPTPTPLPTSTPTSTATATPSPTATATSGQSQTSDTLNLPTRTPTSVPPTATNSPIPLPPSPTPIPPTAAAPPTSAPPANDNNADDNVGDDNPANENEDHSGDGGNDNSDDTGDDHSGSDDNSDGNSGSGGGGDDSGGGNSGSGGGGGDDHSGSSGGGGDDKSGGDKGGGDDD